MPEFTSRWLTFFPDTGKYRTAKTDKSPPEELEISPETGQCGTDETDKSPSVSFGSPVVAHFPENVSPHGLEPPPPDLTVPDPCPVCGSVERWRWVDDRLLCRACLIAGDLPVVAVKIHSHLLDEDLWVVADYLPREQWPLDAPVYTHSEVKLLLQVDAEPLQ